MKCKLFLAILLLFVLPKLNAQVMVSESFENAFPPTGWTLYTGANSFPWQVSTTDPAVNGVRCMKQDGDLYYGSDAWIFTAGYPLTAGINYKLSYWYRCGQGGNLKNFKVTMGTSPTVNSQQFNVLSNYINVSTTTYTQGINTFTVPETNIYYFAFNCYGTYYNRLLIDSVVLEQVSGTSCSGTPPAGVITGPSQICPDTTFTLTNTGISGAGVGYQWQSSAVGANNFTNIAGATSSSYSTTQTTSTDYRCIATCFYSGQTSISGVKTVTSPAFCYCTPPAMVCGTSTYITNITFAGINNTTGCTAPSSYTDYTTTVSPATVSANTTVPVSVTVPAGAAQKYISAWIDFNQNGVFETTERTNLGSATGAVVVISGNIAIPSNAPGGITRIRFRVRNGSYSPDACQGHGINGAGETEDYAVNITPFTCTGTPPVGTVTGVSDICPGTSFTLTMSGTYLSYSLQWESSPVGANNFSPVSGATSASLTTSQTVSTDYRCKVTCVASGLSAYSNIKTVTSPLICYCPPTNFCGSIYISNVSFGSINNSSGCATSGDYTTTVAAADITAGTTTSLSVTLNGGSNGQVAAWIDMNRNGIFEESEYKLIGTGAGGVVTGSFFIPSNTLPGLTRLRVKWLSGASLPWTTSCYTTVNTGETEDYSINILQAPVAMYFNPFADTLYDPSINVTVRIVQRDIGLNATDSLKPRLWAKRQGTSNWKKFKGQLISGTVNDGNWVFAVNNDSLGVRRNGCDSIQFYFVAQDLNIPSNLGYFPEIGALHTNVQTQVTPPNSLFGYRLKPRLKDTVYVSSSDCRYQSLSRSNGLFQEINSRKLEGDLTIIIESDIQESATNELTAAGLNGYRLTIRPDGNTLRTITSQNLGPTSLLKLKGVKNVVIDGSYNGAGRFIAITNPMGSSQYTDSFSCVEISNMCDSITLKNIIFRHAAYLINVDEPGEHAVYIRGSGSRNIFILNNLFTDVPSAIMSARHIGARGGNDNIVIRGNEFNNFTRAGIYAFGACQNWIIDSNHFYRTTVPFYTTSDCSAILTRGGGHTITGNYIGGQAPFCAGGKMTFIDNPVSFINGIEAAGPTSAGTVTIANNRVDNIDMSLTVTARASSFTGIRGTDNDVLIKNNIIGNPQSTTATITPLADGMSGISAGGTGHAEIRDNIVTSISNKAGSGPDYNNVFIVGIGWSNVANGFGIWRDSAIISGNSIYNLHNYNNGYQGSDIETPYTTGIGFSGGSSKVIEKNIIHDISCNENSIGGIVYNSGDSASLTTIQQNRIYDLGNTNTLGGHIIGIRLNAVRNSLDVLNNQLTINNNSQASPVNIWGIQENAGIGVYPNAKKRIIYNSVYIGGIASGSATSYNYNYFEGNVAIEDQTIYNNIFYNERTGGSTGHLIYRVNSTNMNQSLSNTLIDYNFYNLQDSVKFIKWGNTTVQSWTTWRNNNTFDDSSTVSTPLLTPSLQLFLDKAQGNLNIDSTNEICWRVNNEGKAFADIDKDYDSANVRSTDVLNGRTDIGSDEFTTSTLPPPFTSVCSSGSKTILSNIGGSVYQWQVDTGTGFTNISNNANYSGTNTAVLQMSNLPTSWYGYTYRCVVDGNYSQLTTLIFQNKWLGASNNAWENPANWSCGAIPDVYTDVIILAGANNFPEVNTAGSCRSLTAKTGVTIQVKTGAALFVNGDFTLDINSTLNNAGTITINRAAAAAADFTDNTPGPHSYGNGKFIFTGTGGAQNMLGSIFYDVEINNTAGVNMLANHTIANNLALTGGSLNLNNRVLTVNGPVTGSGSLSGSSTSALVIGGAAGTLNFNQASAATRSLNDLTLNSGSSATLGNALDIYGTVALTSASLNLNAKNLTLKSTPANTARIADLTGSTLTGGTNVTMERFIKLRTPGTGAGAANYGRAYRLLCPTVTTSSSIRFNWMNNDMNTNVGVNVNTIPGYGTQISGSGGNANGFDVTLTNQSSLYNTANAIVPTYNAYTSTNGNLNALTGYFLYIRGDRSVNMQLPLGPNMPTTSTTLRATGTVTTGPVSSFTNAFTGGGTLNLVTNPYPSPIDWQLVRAASTGITNYYTFWDPNYGTRGGFVTVSSSETGPLRYIQSGQAFFVESNGTGTPVVNMLESHKAAGNNNNVFLVPPPPAEAFAVQLYFTEPGGYRRLADETDAWYGSNYSAAVNEDDAREINNWDENISIARNGKHLAIEQRPVIMLRDTLPLFMNNMKQQAYEFEFRPQAFTNPVLSAELIDNFLNTRTPLSVVNPTVVAFNVTADAASAASDRFMVVFGPGRPLAIDFISIQARAKNNGVQVNWQAKTETDMDKYEVERSIDGTNFYKQNTTPAFGNSNIPVSYGWFDATPVKGNNFYKVKAFDKAGSTRYTSIVKVNTGSATPAIAIIRNPITNTGLGLQLTDLDKGVYTLLLYNNLGQQVYNTKLQHDGGSALKHIQPDVALANGAYRLVLLGDNNIRLSAAIIKQ